MSDKAPTAAHLLSEVEDLLHTMPSESTIRHDTQENFGWLGRAAAVIELWNESKGQLFQQYLSKFHDLMARPSHEGFRHMLVLLHQAHHDLRMRVVGSTNVAIGHGRVFDFFNEVRKLVELANAEVFFVDPYLDADFASRYLPGVRAGVAIRLLTSDKRLSSLLPAVDLFAQQASNTVSVRSTNAIHDRFVFIDQVNGYQSGASFKDGAKNAPTTLTQITDAFGAVWKMYDGLWSASTIER